MTQKFSHQILFEKALDGQFLNLPEALYLYQNAPLAGLMLTAHLIRNKTAPHPYVTWIIDRNVNITNVCCSGCMFCNFYKAEKHKDAYITSIEEYQVKIDELFEKGGNQLLLQGGLHPHLGLEFYTRLFKELKDLYPSLKLHALGPPEIVHISKMEGISYEQTLKALIEAGLDSLPGAGAEILSDRVRSTISKGKCSTQEWLDVMRSAHKLGLTTSATMMFGHIETIEERLQHMIYLRELQNEKPTGAKGFLSFIPWPFQGSFTQLSRKYQTKAVEAHEYIRMIAISRIMLPNIENIQASWLTVGKETAQICLHSGANDLGSIMIEENVVSAAGAHYQLNSSQMQDAITEAGFIPKRRNQQFEIIG